jgi:hypothetical protein
MSSQLSPEAGTGKSDVMTLVHQLKAGTMSKDDVLEQLRRIQQEKRNSSTKAEVNLPVSGSVHHSGTDYRGIEEGTRDLSTSSSTFTVGQRALDFDSFASDQVQSKRPEPRSWVEEEASLLAEEEEVMLSLIDHVTLQILDRPIKRPHVFLRHSS